MEHLNSSSNPTPSRRTLKLKGARARPLDDIKAPLIPQPRDKTQSKAALIWSGRIQERMQADMDKLWVNELLRHRSGRP